MKWSVVCQPKSQGGLGLLNIDVMNQALLAKWLWKLESGSGLWQTIIKKKYIPEGCVSAIRHRPGNSQFWSGIMGIKNTFYRYCKKKIGNGENTRFWEDWWVDTKPLCKNYTRLYGLCRKKNITVAYILNNGWDSVTFRRTLWGILCKHGIA